MALYSLECEACSHEIEVMQKYSDPLPACPECGSTVRRTIGKTSFRCVGGGWAADNYCSVTPAYKEIQRKMKDAQSGRTRGDGKTPRSALRGY